MHTSNFDEPTEPRIPVYIPGGAYGQAPQQSAGPPGALQAPRQPRQHKRGLSRRAFLGGSMAGLIGLSAGGFAAAEWLTHGGLSSSAHKPLASNKQIGHLLRKAGFGSSPADLMTYSSLGFSGAVDRLINYAQVSDDALENRLKTMNLNLDKPQYQQQWWLLRMAGTQRPLLEKMTLFWHGVLTSSYRKVGGPKVLQRMIIQNQFLREHAFDTFDNILLGMTADPAMLFYLDLTKSRKNAPNENYARELMELFTLGLGNYTQQDVTAGAQALTGWHVKGLTAKYYPADHNDSVKTYLGHSGNLDYKDVIHILTNHPAAPGFICRKLFTFFAYENPSASDLQPLIDTYNQSGHNMGAVMRTLLLSPQFSSQQAYRSRLKSPAEFAVGMFRALQAGGDGSALPAFTALMGQPLFDPPNVAGWPGDKVSSLWLNSGTWMSRMNYIDLLLARGASTGKSKATPLDLQTIVNANAIDTPEHFVDYFATFLLDGEITSDRKSLLIDYFTTSDTSRYGGQVKLTSGKSYAFNRVRGTLYLMLASPEYQLN